MTLQWRNVFVVTIAGAEMTEGCALLHYCTTKILKQHCHWVLLRYWSGLICCELSPVFFFNCCTVMQNDTQSISNNFIVCLVSHIDFQSCMDP